MPCYTQELGLQSIGLHPCSMLHCISFFLQHIYICDRISENLPLSHLTPKYFHFKQGIAQHKSTLQWARNQSVPWTTRGPLKCFNTCMCTAVAATLKCWVLFISRVTKWLIFQNPATFIYIHMCHCVPCSKVTSLVSVIDLIFLDPVQDSSGALVPLHGHSSLVLVLGGLANVCYLQFWVLWAQERSSRAPNWTSGFQLSSFSIFKLLYEAHPPLLLLPRAISYHCTKNVSVKFQ